jgi:hypothetical protein
MLLASATHLEAARAVALPQKAPLVGRLLVGGVPQFAARPQPQADLRHRGACPTTGKHSRVLLDGRLGKQSPTDRRGGREPAHLVSRAGSPKPKRTQLVHLGMQNRTFGPNLAAVHRNTIPVMQAHAARGPAASIHHRLCIAAWQAASRATARGLNPKKGGVG